MNIDATFWVAVSFVIFVGIIFYLKVPQMVYKSLEDSIKKIKKDIDDAEKLKDEAKNILSEHEAKVSKSKQEIEILIKSTFWVLDKVSNISRGPSKPSTLTTKFSGEFSEI